MPPPPAASSFLPLPCLPCPVLALLAPWRLAIRNSPHLLLRGRRQLHQVLFGVPVVALPRRGQSGLGELQRPRTLLERQHRLGRQASVAQVRRRPLDEALEDVLGGVGLPPLDVDLPAAQLVVVAPPALVVLAVEALALVDVVQGGVGVALVEGLL